MARLLTVASFGPLHHQCRCVICSQLVGHELHVWIDVMKEMLVTGAEIVQAIFAGWRLNKTMFEAFAIAGKAYVALLAVCR